MYKHVRYMTCHDKSIKRTIKCFGYLLRFNSFFDDKTSNEIVVLCLQSPRFAVKRVFISILKPEYFLTSCTRDWPLPITLNKLFELKFNRLLWTELIPRCIIKLNFMSFLIVFAQLQVFFYCACITLNVHGITCDHTRTLRKWCIPIKKLEIIRM